MKDLSKFLSMGCLFTWLYYESKRNSLHAMYTTNGPSLLLRASLLMASLMQSNYESTKAMKKGKLRVCLFH